MMNAGKTKLSLILEDIMMEFGGIETVNILKEAYSNYSIEYLLEFAKNLLQTSSQSHPYRYKIFIRDYLDCNEYIVIYSENSINYKEMLIAFVILMQCINKEDRPGLIINLARVLNMIDNDISNRFAKDIASKVYLYYKKDY